MEVYYEERFSDFFGVVTALSERILNLTGEEPKSMYVGMKQFRMLREVFEFTENTMRRVGISGQKVGLIWGMDVYLLAVEDHLELGIMETIHEAENDMEAKL